MITLQMQSCRGCHFVIFTKDGAAAHYLFIQAIATLELDEGAPSILHVHKLKCYDKIICLEW